MNDSIHKTHFPVTKEMPWREKEKQAILLLKRIVKVWDNKYGDTFWTIDKILRENKELVDWVMKYND